MQVLQQMKRLPHDPATPLWGTHPKEMKSLFQRDICMALFTAALLRRRGKNFSVAGWIHG